MAGRLRPPTGHVFRVERARGAVWYSKYRLPDGRQVQKKLGPAWTGRGRPPAGYFTKRLAGDWLRGVLEEARRGTLPGMVRTGATFADAAAEYLRYIEHDRGRKPSTLRGYRSAIEAHLLPAFGAMPIEAVTTDEIEGWIARFGASATTRNKLLIQLHGILGRARKAYGLPGNAAAKVEKFPQRRSGDIDVFSPEEVWALVRAAASEQDGAMYLTAAFTGLRMGELLALRWRDGEYGVGVNRYGASRRKRILLDAEILGNPGARRLRGGVRLTMDGRVARSGRPSPVLVAERGVCARGRPPALDGWRNPHGW